MSSESDPDEFFDAQDVTPARVKRVDYEEVAESDGDTPEVEVPDVTFDLEEEERRLLQARQQAEERRRLEDEEIQQKLAALEERKKQERERIEAERRAQEKEKRRRRLEEFRDIIDDETTPDRPPKPPRIFIDRNLDGPSPSKCEAEEKVVSLVAGIPSEAKDIGAVSNLEKADGTARDLKSAQSSNSAQSRTFSSQSESCDTQLQNALSDPQNALSNPENEGAKVNFPRKESEKLLHKNIPVLVTDEDTSRSDMSLDRTGEDNTTLYSTNADSSLEKPEPDIVQSTKPRPAGLPAPVAPPRRKRKNKAPTPPNITPGSDEGETGKDLLQVKGLPTGLPTPTSTVLTITRDLEQSLDLQSATSGTCIVTAKEEASAKAETILEEAETMSHSSNETKTSGASSSIIDNSKQRTAPEKEEEEENQMRPRTNSGSRFLTDKEILDMVSVLNLDTGEKIPLSAAEDKLPQGVNPLSLHIMRRTKEYSSDSSLHKVRESDDENKGISGTQTIRKVKMVKNRTTKIKRLIGKTVHKIKTKADGVLHGENEESDEEDDILDGRRMIKVKASSSHKGPYDFDLLVPVQELGHEHNGAIWTMKFSHCGRLLATGGQDNLLRVWVLKDCSAYFDDMRQKYSEAAKVSPAPSQDSLNSQGSQNSEHAKEPEEEEEEQAVNVEDDLDDEHSPFVRRPFCVYRGHTADLLDLSWSKNYFILSSSMDKTVRLWHISRKECLCCFQHIDFVTAIAFHPRDDRYFLSGSLDGKLRLWNIPDKKVALWNEVLGQSKLITAANFCLNGRFAVVGTYDGRCIFYSTEQLKYYTQIHVRSTRGRNARGRKITGVEPFPGEDKIMVTSNDSRIRLYDLRDLTLTCKYKGCANNSSQIKASFNHDGKYIICGSEDHFVYVWRSQHEFYKYTSARRDRNDFWEGIKAHTAVVTAAIFAPNPAVIIKPQFDYVDSDNKDGPSDVRGEVLVSADFSGAIKVFINKFKPGSG